MTKAKTLLETINDVLEKDRLPQLTIVRWEGGELQQLDEGRWISGRFDRNIRIDQPTHLQGAGQPHAHIYGRKGNELGVVNLDGSPSHGTRCKLHDKDADELRNQGFDIPDDNIVEWISLEDSDAELLLG